MASTRQHKVESHKTIGKKVASKRPKAVAVKVVRRAVATKRVAKKLAPKKLVTKKPARKKLVPAVVAKPTKKPAPQVRKRKKVQQKPVVIKKTAIHRWALRRAQSWRDKYVGVRTQLNIAGSSYLTHGNPDGTADGMIMLPLAGIDTMAELYARVRRLQMAIGGQKWPKGTYISMGFTIPPQTIVAYNLSHDLPKAIDPRAYMRIKGKMRVASRWKKPVRTGLAIVAEAAMVIAENVYEKFGQFPTDVYARFHSSSDGSVKRSR